MQVIETMRVVRGRVLNPGHHVARASRGLARLSALPVDAEAVGRAVDRAIAEAREYGPDVVLRLAWKPSGDEWPARRWKLVCTVRSAPEPSAYAPVKLRSLRVPPMAMTEAKFGADYGRMMLRVAFDAPSVPFAQVLRCWRSRVLGATTANLCLRVAGQWLTPADGAGVLPGKVRALLLRLEAVLPARITVPMLAEAEAAALCNAGWLIRPVAGIDDRPLPRPELVSELARVLEGMPGVPGWLGKTVMEGGRACG